MEVYSFEKIVYENIYPNIDWVIYKNERGVKYDFVVKPNGDPNQIQFKAKWVEKMSIDASGNLILENRLGKVQENKPISFQNEKQVETFFVLKENLLTFKLGDYNKNETIIIDPDLVWGSYYGGASSDAVFDIATDSQGNVYFCGSTLSTTGIAQGGFLNNSPVSGGFGAAFLVKFNADGQRIWGTYYGGTSYTGAFSCKIDSQDNIIIAGTTDCSTGISFNGYQNQYGGGGGLFDGDGFIVKFNPAGERIWATYFGGLEGDSGTGMDVDSQDNIYLTGWAKSFTGIALNGHQNNLNPIINLMNPQEPRDAYLAKFSSSGALLWSSYFGGSGPDEARSVNCANNGDVFIAGRTNSLDFPTLNPYQSSSGNPSTVFKRDGYLVKFSASGSLLWSTYFGGSETDEIWGCSSDNLGNVFICGRTNSSNNIFFNGFRNGNGGSFLAKFNSSGTRLWGTYYTLGDVESNGEWGFACATDTENNVYLAGRTGNSTNIASQGFQNTYGGGAIDGYIVKFNPAGGRVWGSYYGGAFQDGIRGMHVDVANQIYVGGSTASSNNIFFQGFQSTVQNETGFIAKIGCPNPQLLSLPEEICANESISIVSFPVGGSLQLIGLGSLVNNTYTAPNAIQNTSVILQYTTLANSSCPSTSNSFTINVLPNVIASVNVTSNNLVICQDESAAFEANVQNAGSSPEVQWFLNNQLILEDSLTFISNTLSNNDIIKCVVISSNVCATPNEVQSNPINITVNPLPAVSVVFTDLNGGVLVSSTGFNSYQWFLNDQPISGANESTYIPTANGNYSVTVTNEFGCESSAGALLTILSLNGVVMESMSIYPNPNNGSFTIQHDLTSPKITVYSLDGKVVFEGELMNKMTTMNLDLMAGTYLVELEENGLRGVKRIVLK